MKCMRLIPAVLIYSIFGVSTLASSVALAQRDDAWDHFAYGGDNCHTRNPTVKDIRRIGGSLKNISEVSPFNVTCPLIVKGQRSTYRPGDNELPVNIWIQVEFKNSHTSMQSFSCKFTGPEGDGPPSIRGGTEKVQIPSGEGGGVSFIFDEVNSDALFRLPPRVECKLPPLSEIRTVSVLVEDYNPDNDL